MRVHAGHTSVVHSPFFCALGSGLVACCPGIIHCSHVIGTAQDVLVLCGGNMPAWVEQLMFTCKFLFPFDIRRRFFYCTSSGLFRALQHLQQQHSIEGLSTNSSSQDRDLRFSRIQRAKVGSMAGCALP